MSEQDEVKRLLKSLVEQASESDDDAPNKGEAEEPFDCDVQIETLTNASRHLFQAKQFNPGDLVTFVDGLQNRKRPQPGYPAMVVRHCEPYNEGHESGTPLFGENVDTICAVVLPHGSVGEFGYDSRRLTKLELTSH